MTYKYPKDPAKVQMVGHEIGKLICDYRRKMGLTQAQLAVRMTLHGCPMDYSGVKRRELGRSRTDMDELFAFAASLNMDPADLIAPIRRKEFLRFRA